MVTVTFCWTVIVRFSKWICASVRKGAHTHTHTSKKKQLNPCSEPLWSIQLPGNHIITTMSPTFRKLASSPTSTLFLLICHKHAPTQTSCRSCPLTSPQPCSGPETRRPEAWCQTEWVSQGLSGPLVPEQPLSSGNRHWKHVYLLALLCRNETDRMKRNYKGVEISSN